MDFTYLDQYLDSLLDEGFPMYDCTIHVGYEEVYRRCGGFTDVASRRTHEPDTRYFLYSCSKPITTCAALTLLEKGKFRLHDPIDRYLPEFAEMKVRERRPNGEEILRPAKTKITVRDLFTMTAGFSYNVTCQTIKDAVAQTGGKAPTREIVRAFAKEPLFCDPGSYYRYSLCHDVLAALCEVVSGVRFADYVRETVFTPLGMKNSTFHLSPEEMKETMATQYSYKAAERKSYAVPLSNYLILGDEYDSGGAGVISTTEDYILFAEAMANGGVGRNGARILAPTTIDLWRTPALTPQQKTTFDDDYFCGYSYGLGVRTMENRGIGGSIGPNGEFGWSGAAGSLVYISPETNVSIFCAQHMLQPPEGQTLPALRNVAFACLGR